MPTLDFESEQFFTLLTDALRAGPGSPQWHQAVGKLRAGGVGAGGDEYKLLIAARENLESGKSYRSVRAGPGFTRKLMERIDTESDAKHTPVPSANVVAFGSAAVALVILGILTYFLVTGQGHPSETDNLVTRYYGTALLTATFDGNPPAGWNVIGEVPLTFNKELKTASAAKKGPADGGGIVSDSSILADQTFALEVTLRPGRSDDPIPQVFVTDDPDFSPDKATTPHELAWFIQSHKPQVALPDQTLVGHADEVKDLREPLSVRILMNRDMAAVQTAGKLIWSGPNGLSASSPRYVGVRFLHRGTESKLDGPAVLAIKVLK